MSVFPGWLPLGAKQNNGEAVLGEKQQNDETALGVGQQNDEKETSGANGAPVSNAWMQPLAQPGVWWQSLTGGLPLTGGAAESKAAPGSGVFGVGNLFGLQLPAMQFSARPREGAEAPVSQRRYEPDESTTKDVERDLELAGNYSDFTSGEEEEDVITDMVQLEAQQQLLLENEVRSVRSAAASVQSARSAARSGTQQEGTEGRGIHEQTSVDIAPARAKAPDEQQGGNQLPKGPYRKRPRSRETKELPISVEGAFTLLKIELWGKAGVPKSANKDKRLDWQLKVAL
jgi:hypothetical protein